MERVIRRDFPAKVFAEVQSTLDSCDASSGPASMRVKLAVLKLADGDLVALRRSSEAAKLDYRDVLAWAEYPNYMRRVPGPGQTPEVEKIIEADWDQYQAWLMR